MCGNHVIQSEEHTKQLNEENDRLTSNIRQEAAHCKAMETEQVSSGTSLLDCITTYGNFSPYFKQSMINLLLISNY